jgi:intracellular proteinase inhibitor BsuPI
MMRGPILALVLMLAALPGETRASQSSQPPPLVMLLATDQSSYQPGATVTFSLAVDNPGPVPVRATLPSGQRYDLAVFAGEAEVWRWSADRDFADAEAERSFSPGVTLLGHVTWEWRDTAGAPLPPGTYRVVGELTATPPRTGNVLQISLRQP